MNYEKKYNGALERAKDWVTEREQLICPREIVESIFPELAESEDERLLREFNDYLCEEIECRTNDVRDEKDRRTLNMLCYILTKVKDWLEKQKEQDQQSFTYQELKEAHKQGIQDGMILGKERVKKDFTDESEEEKIRKDLIGGLMWQRDNLKSEYPNDNNLILQGFCLTVGEHLAYLEKQKERSMSAEEVLSRAGLKPYKDGNQWCILAGDNIQEGICGFGDTIDEALYQFLMEVLEKQKVQPTDAKTERVIKAARRVLNNWLDGTDCPDVSGDFAELEYAIREYDGEEKQKEQKPDKDTGFPSVTKFVYNKSDEEFIRDCANILKGNDYGVSAERLLSMLEQKPAEWSEKEKELQRAIVDSLCYLRGLYSNKDKVNDYNRMIEYAKSTRPRPQGVFEQAVRAIYETCHSYRNKGVFTDERACDFMGNVRIKCKDAIECSPILDEPHWKPSEEQMKALSKVVNGEVLLTTQHESLESLYEHLKKLMEDEK